MCKNGYEQGCTNPPFFEHFGQFLRNNKRNERLCPGKIVGRKFQLHITCSILTSKILSLAIKLSGPLEVFRRMNVRIVIASLCDRVKKNFRNLLRWKILGR